jgi:hypothetical protein
MNNIDIDQVILSLAPDTADEIKNHLTTALSGMSITVKAPDDIASMRPYFGLVKQMLGTGYEALSGMK